MERTPEFVVKKLPEQKSAKMHEKDELRSDFLAFPGKIQPLLRNHLTGKTLPPADESALHDAINIWWQDKYGFPHTDKIARSEVLRLKYSAPKDLVEANKLQEELFLAIKKNDPAEIKALKKIYREKYPDQLEGG